MAVEPQSSDQVIASPAPAGWVEHADGDEHAGAAHTSVLVAVAVYGSATGPVSAWRPSR
jgi:hypothetical protein